MLEHIQKKLSEEGILNQGYMAELKVFSIISNSNKTNKVQVFLFEELHVLSVYVAVITQITNGKMLDLHFLLKKKNTHWKFYHDVGNSKWHKKKWKKVLNHAYAEFKPKWEPPLRKYTNVLQKTTWFNFNFTLCRLPSDRPDWAL